MTALAGLGLGVRRANCPGDVAGTFTPGEPKGPSYAGEWWFVTDATFDAERDRTVVGFTLVPPALPEAARA